MDTTKIVKIAAVGLSVAYMYYVWKENRDQQSEGNSNDNAAQNIRDQDGLSRTECSVERSTIQYEAESGKNYSDTVQHCSVQDSGSSTHSKTSQISSNDRQTVNVNKDSTSGQPTSLTSQSDMESKGNQISTQQSISDAVDVYEDTPPSPSNRMYRSQTSEGPSSLEEDVWPILPRGNSQDVNLHPEEPVRLNLLIAGQTHSQNTHTNPSPIESHHCIPQLSSTVFTQGSTGFTENNAPINDFANRMNIHEGHSVIGSGNRTDYNQSSWSAITTTSTSVMSAQSLPFQQYHNETVETSITTPTVKMVQTSSFDHVTVRNEQSGSPNETEIIYDRSDSDQLNQLSLERSMLDEERPEILERQRLDSEPVTDAEPYLEETLEDIEIGAISDGVVLHAEADREAATKFIEDMESEFSELNPIIRIYDELPAGKSHFRTAADLFDSCRFLFILISHNYKGSDLERFLGEIALMESILTREKSCRVIPLEKEECNIPEFSPLISLQYRRYIKAKSAGRTDQSFSRVFKKLIEDGRKKYLSC